ncbi:hypothetical protein GCM10028807_32540 [Spirosoma daeguense]
MPNGKTIIVKLPRLAIETVLSGTDQDSDYIYYLVPIGQDGAVSLESVYSPLRNGWKRYLGNIADLDTECGIDVTPAPEDPYWNGTVDFPEGIKGQLYEAELRFTYLTPASGKTIVDIIGASLPDFLKVFARPNDNPVLRGTLPSDYSSSAVSFELQGIQSDGRTANKSFAFLVSSPAEAPAMRAYLIATASDRMLRPLIGPLSVGSNGTPKVQIVEGPTGVNKSEYQTTRFDATLGGLEYNYHFLGWVNMPIGEYALKFTHNGVVKYAKAVWNGASLTQALTLQDTQPTVNNDTPTTPPPETAKKEVVAIDARWYRAKPGDPNAENQYTFFFKISNGGGMQLDIDAGPDFGAGVRQNNVSGFYQLTNDPSGYTHAYSTNGITNQLIKVWVRPTGSPAGGEVSAQFQIPGGASLSVPRTTIYPTSGGGNDTTDKSGTRLSATFTY